MNNSDTPEADAFLKEYYPEHPEAAWVRTQLGVTFEGPLEQKMKKLERQRDEYRKKYDTEATEHMLAVNKLCNERDEYREVLGFISYYLSVGSGDETTTPLKYKDRILDGIKMLTDPLMDRIKEAEEGMVEGTVDGGSIEEQYLMVQVPISPVGYRVGQKVKVVLPEPKLYNNEP